MKKYFLPLSITLNALAFLYIFNFSDSHNNNEKDGKNAPKSHVVILNPAIHPSLEQIESGVIENIKNNLPKTKITTMNANGKKTLMLAQVHEALNSKPDAIVTIGAQASQLTHEVIKKRNDRILHVFTAVTAPEKIGLAYDPKTLTGIVEKSDYQLTSKTLRHLAPHIQSLLLVYNPSEGNSLDQERQELEKALIEHEITLTPLEIFHSSEITAKTKSLISKHDGIIVLKDNSVVAGLDGLVKLCEQNNKLLIAHDLDSSDRGAALTFGCPEKSFGLAAGKIIVESFDLNKKTLPEIKAIEDNKIKINSKTAPLQNLIINDTELTLLRSVIII